jgi:hypothetical protein
MNALIRRAARGRSYVPNMEPDGRAHEGSIGIGRGAGSAPRRPPSRSQQISTSIRDAAGLLRERVTIDDLYGR